MGQQVQGIQGNDEKDFSIYKDEVRIGEEKLYEISSAQMLKPIHKNIVALLWKNIFSYGRGSGLLISKNLVLTSAHNFFHKGLKINQDLFKVYPGQCGILKKGYEIEKIFIPSQYKNSPENMKVKYDYALIKLTKQVKYATDFIELNGKFNFDQKKQQNSIKIFGYPDFSYKEINLQEEIQTVTQWGFSKTNAILAIRQKKGEILHSVSTEGGQSGSPIILQQAGKLSVIGIHKGRVTRKIYGKQMEANAARLLDQQLVEILKSEAQKMSGDMFKVRNYQKEKNDSVLLSQDNEDHKNEWPQKVIDCYKIAIKNNPKDANAYKNLGKLFINMNQMQQAIDCLQKAIQINPQDSQAYSKLGRTLIAIHEEPTQGYRKAISQTYINSVKDLTKVNLAIDCYRRAIRIDPKNPSHHYRLGEAYQHILKDKQSAIYCYQQAHQIDRKNQIFKSKFNRLKEYFRKNNQIPQGLESYFKKDNQK